MTDYEKSMADRKAAEAVAAEKFAATVALIAKTVGGGVRPVGTDPDATSWATTSRTVDLPDGGSFYVHRDTYRKKMTVGGNYPRDAAGGDCAPYRDRPGIGLGLDRDGVAAGKDIGRRFLPAYKLAYAEALKRKDDADTRLSEANATISTIAGLLGEVVAANSSTSTKYVYGRGKFEGIDTEITTGGVGFKLNYLPHGLAVEVVKALMPVFAKHNATKKES